MRERFGGFALWNYVNKRLRIRNLDLNINKEREKTLAHTKDLREVALEAKRQYYLEKRSEWFTTYHANQGKLRDPRRQIRKHKRRCSDGFHRVNMEALYADRIYPSEQNHEK